MTGTIVDTVPPVTVVLKQCALEFASVLVIADRDAYTSVVMLHVLASDFPT